MTEAKKRGLGVFLSLCLACGPFSTLGRGATDRDGNGTVEPTPWIVEGRMTPEARRWLAAIENDETMLCTKRRYRLAEIKMLAQLAPIDKEAEREVNGLVERAIRRYRRERLEGCLDPCRVFPEQTGIDGPVRKKGENLLIKRLLTALGRYETLRRSGGWEAIEGSFHLLKEGDRHPAVLSIKKRLSVTGEYGGVVDGNTTFGFRLAEAVRIFQRRHGLKADGIVGPATRRWLDMPIEKKITLLKLNLERLRWLTDEEEDFIVANIPDFTLGLYRHGERVLSMKIVVGRKDRPTPMIADTLTYTVLNPYWRAPKTIVEEDILPKLKAGRWRYFQKAGIVAVSYKDPGNPVDLEKIDWRRYGADTVPYLFMQKPGPKNYLGLVKFMFPNDFDVYLHDSPHHELFEKRYRAKSSGCIRLQKPIELFHELYDPDDEGSWSYRAIVNALIEGNERLVGLKRPIRVYLLYMTAFVDEEGALNFREDLYGYDRKMLRYLNEVEYTPFKAASSLQ